MKYMRFEDTIFEKIPKIRYKWLENKWTTQESELIFIPKFFFIFFLKLIDIFFCLSTTRITFNIFHLYCLSIYEYFKHD